MISNNDEKGGLEAQAYQMALKAMPSSVADVDWNDKFQAVKQKILVQLQKRQQRQGIQAAVAATQCVAPPPPPPMPSEQARFTCSVATPVAEKKQLKVDGAELLGDELWFADPVVRARLRLAVAETHREQKICVGSAEAEINRVCPEDGRVLGSGAVLHLYWSRYGGFGESDIAYAYRQMSRVLHPDKNPHLSKAPIAFQRLSEAADDLRQALKDQRLALQALASVLGQHLVPESFDRPQEALFAEALRVLTAVCGIDGEGLVPPSAQGRSVAAFTKTYLHQNVQAQGVLFQWFEKNELLSSFGGVQLRTCYDCAPKRHRAQFLCLLNRVLLVEARRCSGCVRAAWGDIMKNYPELSLWRSLRECMQSRTLDTGEAEDNAAGGEEKRERSRSPKQKRSKWDIQSDNPAQDSPERESVSTPSVSRWAKKWRAALKAILPSGHDRALPATHPEVRKLAFVMWKDIAKWVGDTASHASPGLELFRADAGPLARGLEPEAAPKEWAFIPVSDILLIIGNGVVGITAEGVFADNPEGHVCLSLAECYKKRAGD